MTATADLPAVVAGVDGSDSALGAARWAADYAAGHPLGIGRGLPLLLVHAVPTLDWHFFRAESPMDPTESQARAAGDAVLAAAEAAVRAAHPDLEIRAAVVRGAVAAVLTDAARSARLLVVGNGDAEHRALGGHAVRVVNHAHCPVVVWRPHLAKRTGKPLPVVVGVDDSEESAAALAEAFAVARMWHARLTVAHMWEIAAAVGMGDLGGQGNMDWPLLDVLENRQRQSMDELVKPFAAEYPNAHVTKVFQDASPAKGLTDLSREAQLVVVGKHGRGRLADSILGSVSQNLIHHAECPVLVVR